MFGALKGVYSKEAQVVHGSEIIARGFGECLGGREEAVLGFIVEVNWVERGDCMVVGGW